MTNTKTITGFYGSHNTPCTVFTLETEYGTWYAVEDSTNVNFVPVTIEDGVDVELLPDTDYFNWPHEVDSEEELERAVEA